MGFWTIYGAPIQRIRCPECKAELRYAATGWLSVVYYAAWFAIGVLAFVLARAHLRAFVVVVVLAMSPGPLLQVPYAWYLRRRGRLEVRPAT